MKNYNKVTVIEGTAARGDVLAVTDDLRHYHSIWNRSYKIGDVVEEWYDYDISGSPIKVAKNGAVIFTYNKQEAERQERERAKWIEQRKQEMRLEKRDTV